MKAYRIIHIAANILAFGLLGAFLVYFLLSYNGLPERIGVHFSAIDGQLDVYSYKVFGFFPFGAGFGLLTIFSLLTLAVNKIKKLGLKVTEDGKTVFRHAAALLLDLMKLTWSVFFSVWTYCVVHQTGMGDGGFLDAFRIFFLLILLSMPVLFSRIQDKYRVVSSKSPKDDDEPASVMPKKFRIQHIIANIIAFGSLGFFLIYFLISYQGLPERIGVHFSSGGIFDVYSYKAFGFYPFVAGFGLLLIFSLLTIAAKKIKRIGMNVNKKGDMITRIVIIEALDCMKFLWAAFFSMWAYCVIHQVGMQLTFRDILISAFLALFPITAVILIITAKKYRIKDNDDTQEIKETEK